MDQQHVANLDFTFIQFYYKKRKKISMYDSIIILSCFVLIVLSLLLLENFKCLDINHAKGPQFKLQ